MVSTVSTITQGCPLTIEECANLPYSPALLLESRFDASLTDDPEFRLACKHGFEAYFEEMYQLDEGWNEAFVEKRRTWNEVAAFVDETVGVSGLHGLMGVSFAWGAGFGLGWLSAHALVEREDAVIALGLFTGQIERRREAVAKRQAISQVRLATHG